MTGRVSYIFKRCSKAKNKYSKPYFPKQESKHITYLESNNLYGYTISKFIPTKRFKWIDPKDFDSSIYIAAIVQQVVFQKWISYLLNYYVNCAMINLYKIEIKIKKKKKMLSKYQLLFSNLYIIPSDNVKKLVLNFFD